MERGRMMTIDTYEGKVLTARLEVDLDATSPREWDNLSTFVSLRDRRETVQGEEEHADLLSALLMLGQAVDARTYDALTEAIEYRDMGIARRVLLNLIERHYLVYGLHRNGYSGSVSCSPLTVEDIERGRPDGLA